jgi:hypothetical protein
MPPDRRTDDGINAHSVNFMYPHKADHGHLIATE